MPLVEASRFLPDPDYDGPSSTVKRRIIGKSIIGCARCHTGLGRARTTQRRLAGRGAVCSAKIDGGDGLLRPTRSWVPRASVPGDGMSQTDPVEKRKAPRVRP